MKKYFVFLMIYLTVFFQGSIAQSKSSKFPETKPRQNTYIELGGNGIAFAATYETRLNKSSDGMGMKIGIGGFTNSNQKLLSVPIGTNWLFSKDNKSFFEVGFGTTFLHYVDYYNYMYNGINQQMEIHETSIAGLSLDSKNSFIGNLTIGYRRQPSEGGITWGVAATPHFNKNGFWPLWFSVKFGYSFARK